MSNVKSTIYWQIRVGDAIGVITDNCDCTIPEVVEALRGAVINDNEAKCLLEYHSNEDHNWASVNLRRDRKK